MKIIKYTSRIILIMLFAVGFNACDLSEYNPSGVTGDAIWSTPEGMETLIAASYSYQRELYGKENALFMNESGTDLWFNAGYQSYSNELSRYENLTPLTGNFNISTWPRLYQAVNSCNTGLDMIDKIEYPSDEIKNQKKAELHFLRAWYYWHIVEFYGGVTLYTKGTQGVVLEAHRSPVSDFYDLILSDLEFAVDNLPNDQGDMYSRATKKSALGMLARAALSAAYYYDGAERDDLFKKALNAAKEVINNQSKYGVELWQNFADVYNPNNNKRNKEALYVISNSTNDNLNQKYGNRAFLYFSFKYYTLPGMQRTVEYGRGDSRFMPTLALLDFFDEQKDSRYDATFRECWLCNNEETIPKWTFQEVLSAGLNFSLVGKPKFAVGDTAVYVTKKSVPNKDKKPYMVVDRDDIYYTKTTKGINPKGSRYYPEFIKFRDPFREDPSDRYGHLDVIVIRLAEMYLIAAEAELQLGNQQAAADYLNVLRTRAAKKTPVDYTEQMQVSASDVTLDFILDERARELCGEWIRWFDLKRTGKLIERVHKYNPDITAIKDFHTLRPIPQTELDALLNGDEYGNNPGY